MYSSPPACDVELDELDALILSCQGLSESLALIAGSLNTAPVTLAALSKECAIVTGLLDRFRALLGEFETLLCSALLDDICKGPLQEISECIHHLQIASSRLRNGNLAGLDDKLPQGQVAIIWNEHALKGLLRELGANRTSMEFLMNCAISQHDHAEAMLRLHSPPSSPSTPRDKCLQRRPGSSLGSPGFGHPLAVTRVSDMPGVRLALEELRPPPGTVYQCSPTMCARLHAAVDFGDEAAVVQLLLNRVDPNARQPGSSITPLRRAFDKGSSSIATFLAVAGADLEGHPGSGTPALITAIRCGFSDRFAALLCELGACIDATDTGGKSALHHATLSQCDDDTLVVLLHAGADINLRDHSGRTPLMTAVEVSNLQHVHLLAEFGADLEICLPGGATALFISIAKQHYMMTELLKDQGALIDSHLKEHTALTLAISTASTEIAAMLIEGGADTNLQTSTGNTPLLAAASAGDIHITELLLEHHARVDVSSTSGYSPIHMAAHKNRVGVMRLLIDAGSPVDLPTPSNETPLSIAVDLGYPDIVQHLILAGADLDLQLPGTQRPIFSALKARNTEICLRLVQGGGDCTSPADTAMTVTPIHLAAELGLDYVVASMIRAGVHLDSTTWQGYTPLYTAAQAGQSSTVRLLLKSGANPRSRSTSGGNVLFVSTAHPAVVKLLVEHGVDINERDLYGATALHYAALWGHAAGAKILLQKGARIKHANSVFETMADLREGTPYRQGTPAGLAKQKGHVQLSRTIERWKIRI